MSTPDVTPPAPEPTPPAPEPTPPPEPLPAGTRVTVNVVQGGLEQARLGQAVARASLADPGTLLPATCVEGTRVSLYDEGVTGLQVSSLGGPVLPGALLPEPEAILRNRSLSIAPAEQAAAFAQAAGTTGRQEGGGGWVRVYAPGFSLKDMRLVTRDASCGQAFVGGIEPRRLLAVALVGRWPDSGARQRYNAVALGMGLAALFDGDQRAAAREALLRTGGRLHFEVLVVGPDAAPWREVLARTGCATDALDACVATLRELGELQKQVVEDPDRTMLQYPDLGGRWSAAGSTLSYATLGWFQEG